LQALELAGQEIAPVIENKKELMQPAVSKSRLEIVRLAAATESNTTRDMQNITTIPSKNINAIATDKTTKQLLVASIDQTYIHVESLPGLATNENSSSAIANTFTKISSGEYFELAKQKVNDFVSKEHYVNFAIGNVEFGQTIQLSK
jgi:hypothetical protein